MSTSIVPTPDSSDNLKRCSKCGELKPHTEFYLNRKGRSGIDSYCKSCASEMQRQWRIRTQPGYKERYEKRAAKPVPKDGHKFCNACGEEKPFSEFTQRKDGGWNSDCKACRARKAREQKAQKRLLDPRYNMPPVPAGMKRCGVCGCVKALEEFHVDKRLIDGRTGLCSDCRNAYYRKWKALRRPLKPVTPDGMKKCHRCGKVKSLDQYERGRINGKTRGVCKDCEDITSHSRRAAEKRGLCADFTLQDWNAALDYFDNHCAACGRQPGLWHTLAMDHWIPLSSQDCPGTVPWNMVPLCHGQGGCNNSKHKRNARVWLIDKFGKRKGMAILRRIETYLESRKPPMTESA